MTDKAKASEHDLREGSKPIEHQMLVCNAVKQAEAAQGQVSARELAHKIANACHSRCKYNDYTCRQVEEQAERVLAEAFARSQGEVRNG